MPAVQSIVTGRTYSAIFVSQNYFCPNRAKNVVGSLERRTRVPSQLVFGGGGWPMRPRFNIDGRTSTIARPAALLEYNAEGYAALVYHCAERSLNANQVFR